MNYSIEGRSDVRGGQDKVRRKELRIVSDSEIKLKQGRRRMLSGDGQRDGGRKESTTKLEEITGEGLE